MVVETNGVQMPANTLADIRTGAVRSYRGLAVLPLLAREECPVEYDLLEQAYAKGTLTIAEVSEAGAVPYLTAVNRGPRPVLVFDGEELAGAEQNRICNTTILVGVGDSALPVSCFEEGRWSRTYAFFSPGVNTAHPSLRREMEQSVRGRAQPDAQSESVNQSAWPESQQRSASRYGGAKLGVREDVVRTAVCMDAGSGTSAPAGSCTARRDCLDEYVAALGLTEAEGLAGLFGVAVFFEGRFVCVDLLQPSASFRRLYPRLLRGYALEALVFTNKRRFLTHNRVHSPFEGNAVDSMGLGHADASLADCDLSAFTLSLLRNLRGATVHLQTAVDLGEDLRLETPAVSGAGLIWNGALVQLSLFPAMTA